MQQTFHRGAIAALIVFGFSGVQAAESIVFIGNSFTYGAGSAADGYRPDLVTDLNNSGVGGIGSLFKQFTLQAGLDYNVFVETNPGVGLDWHYNNRAGVLGQAWDNVVLHTYSTLSASDPGNPATLYQYSALLADMFYGYNNGVNVNLMATWSRADQTYPSTGAWYGSDIYQMAEDLQVAYTEADARSDNIHGVIPVGQAWNRAMAEGVADTNPYDGIDPGQVKLWANDNYHASRHGSYLEALTIFGSVTGLDPRSLGAGEDAAEALGLTVEQALALQQIAYEQLAAVPEPRRRPTR